MTGFRDATQRRTPPPGPKPAGKPTGKPTTPPAPPAAKPTTKPNTNPNPNPAPNNRPPSPAHRPAHTRKDPDMGIARNPDASLQRWGRDLASISPALDELAEGTGRTAETISGAAEAVKALAELGDSELPADRGLVAEAQAIYADLARIAAAQEALQAQLRQLSTRGDALAASYKRQHETDEARLSGERGGVAREKRADVSAAEQDT